MIEKLKRIFMIRVDIVYQLNVWYIVKTIEEKRYNQTQ